MAFGVIDCITIEKRFSGVCGVNSIMKHLLWAMSQLRNRNITAHRLQAICGFDQTNQSMKFIVTDTEVAQFTPKVGSLKPQVTMAIA